MKFQISELQRTLISMIDINEEGEGVEKNLIALTQHSTKLGRVEVIVKRIQFGVFLFLFPIISYIWCSVIDDLCYVFSKLTLWCVNIVMVI